MVEPNISVRRDRGALVRNETIAVLYTTSRRCGTYGRRLRPHQGFSAMRLFVVPCYFDGHDREVRPYFAW